MLKSAAIRKLEKKKNEKCKMRSNARIEKTIKNAKCAVMHPSEKSRNVKYASIRPSKEMRNA